MRQRALALCWCWNQHHGWPHRISTLVSSCWRSSGQWIHHYLPLTSLPESKSGVRGQQPSWSSLSLHPLPPKRGHVSPLSMEPSANSKISAEGSLGSFTARQVGGLRSMEEMGLVFDSRQGSETPFLGKTWSIGRISLRKASWCCLRAVSLRQMS